MNIILTIAIVLAASFAAAWLVANLLWRVFTRDKSIVIRNTGSGDITFILDDGEHVVVKPGELSPPFVATTTERGYGLRRVT